MTQTAHEMADLPENVRKNWFWFLALGLLLVLGGIFLIAAPHATSVAVTILIAAVLVVGGAVQIWHAFKCTGWTGFVWDMLLGVIAVVGGIVIYTNPLAGTFALTLVIAAVFIVQGISQIIFAVQVKPAKGWGLIAGAGVVSILAGGMIWLEFPSSAAWALGLVAGVSVLFNGWSYISVALTAKSA